MSESLASLAVSFDRSLRVAGKAERTRELYGQSIRYLSDWLVDQGRPAELDELTRETVLGWIDHLRSRGLTDGTVLTRWRGLRRFVLWLLAEEIIEVDPMANIEIVKPEAPMVPVFTDEDLGALITACRGKGFRDRRDEAIIRVLLDTGCRVSELVGIAVTDVDWTADTARVTGKGNRERSLYFSARTAESLDRYRRLRAGHRHARRPELFLGERGPLTADGVRDLLKVRADRAGLDPAAVHPHRFRHTSAHDFLLAGGEGGDLKRLMGWRTDEMLSRYGASAADVRAAAAARRLNRGDRI